MAMEAIVEADEKVLVLTPDEVAERLRVTRNTVIGMLTRGELVYYRAGKQYRILSWSVEELENSNKHKQEPK